VIRLVTLEPFEAEDVTAFCSILFQAFGLGTEHAGNRPLPTDAKQGDGRFDAEKLLKESEPVRTFADDKVIYVAQVPLSLRSGPLGEPPCFGFAQYGGTRAVVSASRITARGATEASIETYQRRLGREMVHAMGHLWSLHHCYDPRCAMHPSWSESLVPNPVPDLCGFCRDKSERKIRLAKT
jgi:predicted Zn-dependent protease